MGLELLIPVALFVAERIMTARGFKRKVPQQVAGYLDALAQGDVDKAPPRVQAALDAYVKAQVKRQIDAALADLAAASKRLDGGGVSAVKADRKGRK